MASNQAWGWNKQPGVKKMGNNNMGNKKMGNNKMASMANAHKSASAAQVTEVYNTMKGFLKSTHWSKPYYSALVHNNPQLPYHLLEHVNCTYLSTPGRAPTLLALKQHAQSLAVLISLLAPSQFGGTFEPPNEGKANGDAPFAAEQAFDWLNDLQEHYNTEDSAHKKPLNALVNLVKSNSDTEGPKWHCPLDTTGIEFPEKHPFQQYRPYETHMTLLMHANEILERLDHEYSAMGGILGIIPLDSDEIDEQRALKQAKTTLVGQWILHTQHLVVRMHELEIAYGNSLDLLANEAIVPLQHISIHGPDGRSGREIIFPQDRWILANAGEDVFTFVHQMLDRAEAHQDAQDDVFAEQHVLGDATYSSNEESKYRGIVKVDLNTRFYRLRKSGHGPLFVLPAFGDRPSTKHTRDMENRPTVVTIPQPSTKDVINAWESKHKDVDVKLLRLSVDKSNLEAKISQLNSSVEMRDREIQRLLDMMKEFEDKISDEDKDFAKRNVYLNDTVRYLQKLIREGDERESALKQDVENFKQANLGVQNDGNSMNDLVGKINDQQAEIRQLRKEIQDRDKKLEDLARDNDTLRILTNPTFSSSPASNPEQVKQLQDQLASAQKERQMMHQEIHNLKKAKMVKGKILNFAAGFSLDYGSTFEDTNQGITVCSSTFYKSLLQAERERNELRIQMDNGTIDTHGLKAKLDKCKAECDQLRKDNDELRDSGNKGKQNHIINLPWGLQYTNTFRDDNQGLIVLRTDWYDHLIAGERTINKYTIKIAGLEEQIKNLKAPPDVNLSGVYDAFKQQIAQSKAVKDTERNIAILALSYFEELQNAEFTRQSTQKRLDECQKNCEVLQHQLDEARTQLQQCVQSQNDVNSQLANLQLQVDSLDDQLTKAQTERDSLRTQIDNMLQNKPESDLHAQISALSNQVNQATEGQKKTQDELEKLQRRYNKLLLNETNLRNEVISLRKQLSDAKKGASTSMGGTQTTGQTSDELRAAQEELKMYRTELATLQKIWNDLQTQHVQLQTRLENAEHDCDEQKKLLQQQLVEANQSIHVLQMKVIADPNKLQPVIIEMEAQRDAARKHRDELHEQLRELQRQLKQEQNECEAAKNALQAKINQLSTST
ncbi:hypothetical protein F4859DRAFT_523982 [Xylaria cf. heliscus]|nr:hypothetical protein F4859DRAFT_523982 [Xylaria cf. heliscus]